MYKFVEPTQTQTTPTTLSEALSLDGAFLETLVEGYQTLNVTGRELIGREHRVENPLGLDGDMYIGSTVPSREITVKYKLTAPTNEEFRTRFNELNKVLHNGGAIRNYSFADEPDVYFMGYLSDCEVPDEGLNSVVSTFTLYCPSPYKRRLSYTSSTDGVVTLDAGKKIKAITIFNLGSSPRNFEIYETKTDSRITLIADMAPNDILIIDFDEGKIFRGVNDVTRTYLSWDSDFELIGEVEAPILEFRDKSTGEIITSDLMVSIRTKEELL